MKAVRISIVRPSVEHTESLVKIHTNPKVRQFLGGPLTQSDATNRAKLITENPDDYCWSVVDKSKVFLGCITVHEHHDSSDLEISYQFLPEFSGNGYAYESIQIVLDYLFDEVGVNQVLAETQLKNLQSIRLLRKLGFHEVKQLERFEETQVLFVKQARDSLPYVDA